MMSTEGEARGVLLLSYGGPRGPEEVEPFVRAVLAGRPVPPAVVAEVERRYELIGGHSPLPAVVGALAAALESRLGQPYRVVVGSLHSRPSISEAVATLAAARPSRAVAVALVPQYSELTVGRYLRRLEQDLEAAGRPFPVVSVRSWATHPLLIRAFAGKLGTALGRLDTVEPAATPVLFTAHSVPSGAIPEGDPYVAELSATAAAVAQQVGALDWRLGFQSAGRSGGSWLGPSVQGVIAELARAGQRQAVVVPVHFLVDNLETLYDLDVALREQAAALGVEIVRVEALNTSPGLVAALADLVLSL